MYSLIELWTDTYAGNNDRFHQHDRLYTHFTGYKSDLNPEVIYTMHVQRGLKNVDKIAPSKK